MIASSLLKELRFLFICAIIGLKCMKKSIKSMGTGSPYKYKGDSSQ
jgi:hypothetical protein